MSKTVYPERLIEALGFADDPDRPDGAWWEEMETVVALYNKEHATAYDPGETVAAYVRMQNGR